LGLSWLRRPIIFCTNLLLKWDMKQNCNPCWKLSNNMWHTTCTQVYQGDSWLLVIGSQIGTLTFGLSFDHNLCFKYSNGMCKPISNIYVSRTFQWYKKLLHPMNLIPKITFWKFENPLGLQLPLGSVCVHSLTPSYTPKSMKCDSWASLLTYTFASLCFGHELKLRDAIACQNSFCVHFFFWALFLEHFPLVFFPLFGRQHPYFWPCPCCSLCFCSFLLPS